MQANLNKAAKIDSNTAATSNSADSAHAESASSHRSDDSTNQASKDPSNSQTEDSYQDLATHLFENYQAHWENIKQIFLVECRISAKSLWVIFILSMLFALLMVTLWLSFIAFIGIALYQAGLLWWEIAGGLFLLNSLVLVLLWRSIKQFASAISFKHSISHLFK